MWFVLAMFCLIMWQNQSKGKWRAKYRGLDIRSTLGAAQGLSCKEGVYGKKTTYPMTYPGCSPTFEDPEANLNSSQGNQGQKSELRVEHSRGGVRMQSQEVIHRVSQAAELGEEWKFILQAGFQLATRGAARYGLGTWDWKQHFRYTQKWNSHVSG